MCMLAKFVISFMVVLFIIFLVQGCGYIIGGVNEDVAAQELASQV